jgi:hypothetical protein
MINDALVPSKASSDSCTLLLYDRVLRGIVDPAIVSSVTLSNMDAPFAMIPADNSFNKASSEAVHHS